MLRRGLNNNITRLSTKTQYLIIRTIAISNNNNKKQSLLSIPKLSTGLLAITTGLGYYFYSTKSPTKTTMKPTPSAKFNEKLITKIVTPGSADGLVKNVEIAQFNSNEPVEDYYSMHKLPNDNGYIFGVYDGHGGRECADIVSTHLPSYIHSRIKAIPSKTSNKKQAITNAISDAFTQLDADILSGSFVSPLHSSSSSASFLRPAIAGSCALVAYIDAKDEQIYVACTGDSRAVLRKRRGDNLECLELSVDQTAQNLHEVDRINELHPGETVIIRGRILGGLMPTRAFGDSRYKWSTKLQSKLQSLTTNLTSKPLMRSTPANFITPPYVTSMPDVVSYKLTKADEFLVLGTDGIYDMLSSEQVIECDDARDIVWRSVQKAGKGKVDELLNIPAPWCRKFRDDMTALVVRFDGDVKNGIALETVGVEDGKKRDRVGEFVGGKAKL